MIIDCQELLENVSRNLNFDYPGITHGLLEKLIWSYQIAQKKLRIVWQECGEIRPGHGVFLYDKYREDANLLDRNVAYIEGYSFRTI